MLPTWLKEDIAKQERRDAGAAPAGPPMPVYALTGTISTAAWALLHPLNTASEWRDREAARLLAIAACRGVSRFAAQVAA